MAAGQVITERHDRPHAAPGAELPADMPGGPQWFYVSGGEEVGPVSLGVVRDLVLTGRIQASSMVWREGMERWAQLGTTPEFRSMPMAATSQPTAAQHYGDLTGSGKKRSGLAVASLVCSLVGVLLVGVVLGPLGIILGGVAISNVNQNPRGYGGKGMALAGLIIGIVDTFLGILSLIWLFG